MSDQPIHPAHRRLPTNREVVDGLLRHALPVLAPFEFKLYAVLVRESLAAGRPQVGVGRRGLATCFGTATRGRRPSYRRINEGLDALAAAGLIAFQTDPDPLRSGTWFQVRLPTDEAFPSVPVADPLATGEPEPDSAEELAELIWEFRGKQWGLPHPRTGEMAEAEADQAEADQANR